jgi:pyrroloquinoline-quinone synthase
LTGGSDAELRSWHEKNLKDEASVRPARLWRPQCHTGGPATILQMTSPTSLRPDAAVARALAGRRLLDHPYYRAWQEGRLTAGDIGRYAAQYRRFEAALPEVLEATRAHVEDSEAAALVEANLEDETAEPSHLDLFDRFAAALGSCTPPAVGATEATARLVGLYHTAAASSPVAALAVIAAYETQAAEIAATKGSALRRHLGLDDPATAFWDVHAGLEADHAAWTLEALDRLEADAETVEQWARSSADAWWAFLDEQEAAALAAP